MENSCYTVGIQEDVLSDKDFLSIADLDPPRLHSLITSAVDLKAALYIAGVNGR